jgi:hypothetical protein
MRQAFGASKTSADLEQAEELRMRPSSLTLRSDHVCCLEDWGWQQGGCCASD